ncbi:MAG: hypothetical protein Q7S87_09040 [Agitococcus sp.]|nr:hypothetical protein [Agitococcus sp.]MDO9177046.1 hypothetical protein [Agitococcus sp.]
MLLTMPVPKDSFAAPSNPELTVAYYDHIPTVELAAVFAHKNKARNEASHAKGLQVQSIFVLHDGTKIQGAILAEAIIAPRFLLMPEGPYLDIQVPWPSLQVWANARCEFLKQKVSLSCIAQYTATIKSLMESMATYEEAFFPLLSFSADWDDATVQVRRRLVQNLLSDGLHAGARGAEFAEYNAKQR